MLGISRMRYPSIVFWISAMVCAFVEVAENLVVLITLGAFRPHWAMPSICYFHARNKELKLKIMHE